MDDVSTASVKDLLLQLSNKLTNIEKRLDRLESETLLVKESAVNIENDMVYIKQSTNNMDYHISFVESVYNAVRLPFARILGANPVSLKYIERSAIEEL